MEWDAFPFTDWNPAFGDQNFELEDPSAFNYDSPSPPEDPCPCPVPAPAPPVLFPTVDTNPSPKLHNVIALPPLNVRSALNPDMPRLFLQKNMVKGKKGYKTYYSIDYSKKEEVVNATSSNESGAKQAVCQRTVSIPWENQMLRYGKLKISNIDKQGFSKRKQNGNIGLYPAPGQEQLYYHENYNPEGYWYQYSYQEQYYGNQENTEYYGNQQVTQGNYYDDQQAAPDGYQPVPDNYPSDGYYNENYCIYSHEQNSWQPEITPNEGLGPITADLPILTDISEYLSTSPEEFRQQYDQTGGNALIESNDYEQCTYMVEEPIAPDFHNYTEFCGPVAERRPEIPANLEPVSNSMQCRIYPVHHMESPVSTGSTVISTPQTASSVPEIVENIYRTAGMRKPAENYEKGQKQGKVAARAPSLYEKRYVPHFKTKDQKAYLEQCFQENHRPTAMELEMISSKLNLSLKQVRTWYYNRRAKANEGPSLKSASSNFSGSTRR